MSVSSRRAVTLIELVAGLALAGVVFLSMLLLVDQLRDGRDRLLENARRDNRVSNGARLLRTLIERAEAGGDSTERFIGSEVAASFVSWCDVPGGWLERCRASVFVERSAESTFVRALLSTGERLELVRARGPVVLRYFDASPHGGWVTAWGNSGALPSAVAIFSDQDTCVVRAGGRG